MSADRHERVGTIFAQARRLAAGERTTFLEEACAGDAGLRDEVKSLVAEHKEELRKLVLQDSTPPCGSARCSGCYPVAPGVSIHPPTPSPDWQDWLRRWRPGDLTQ